MYLENIASFLKVEIINPIFEDILIKCKIKFLNSSGGIEINKLNHDFFKFYVLG